MGKPYSYFTSIRVWDPSLRTNVVTRVDVSIDLQRLAEILGVKAYHNSSGKTRLMQGIVAEVARPKVKP